MEVNKAAQERGFLNNALLLEPSWSTTLPSAEVKSGVDQASNTINARESGKRSRIALKNSSPASFNNSAIAMSTKVGAKKSTQTFFVQSFSKTLRVMDVRAENRGRPHQKVRFSAAPVTGRNFLTQGRPGVRVRNVRGKSGPKSLCLCCFFLP